MAKPRTSPACEDCGLRVARWVGRCPGCGAWGSIRSVAESGAVVPVRRLSEAPSPEARVPSGLGGLDRVLGGGLVPGSVVLLAGEPGIGKSTLLLHLLSDLAERGRSCLLVSGEESHGQVAARARRLGAAGDVDYAPGRELDAVLATARAKGPFLLAVDSIQSLRDRDAPQMPGGVSQVRSCTDALVGLAKEVGVAVVMTGHVTKDGDLAGPRALEHAVDVVLRFEGDPRSGLRVLVGGKNRFGVEGEAAWFEMDRAGLHEVDPSGLVAEGARVPGAAVALPLAGRRALAVEVQALVGSMDGPARRQATGLDLRRFQLMAAVLANASGHRLGRAEIFGASAGGVRVEDPAADLAVAAALTSAFTGRPTPEGSAFVGEVSLTGLVRAAPGMPQRLAAASAAGRTLVFAPPGPGGNDVRIVPVRHVTEALSWAAGGERALRRRAS